MGATLSPLGVQVLTEMTDRNFEVILFLSSWSPVRGMREARRGYEAVAVTVGAWMALMTRLLLIASIQQFRGWLDSFAIVFSPIMLWVLTWRAVSDYRVADERGTDKPSVAAKKAAAPEPGTLEMKEAPPLEQQLAPETLSGEPMKLSQSPWQHESVVMACGVTYFCTFFVTLSDPLRGAEYLDGGFTVSLFVSLVGSLLAAALAVGAGTALEYRIDDRRFLLGASVCLGLHALSATARTILFFWIGSPEQ